MTFIIIDKSNEGVSLSGHQKASINSHVAKWKYKNESSEVLHRRKQWKNARAQRKEDNEVKKAAPEANPHQSLYLTYRSEPGNPRVDPFASFPCPIQPFEHAILNHHFTVMSSMVYGVSQTRPGSSLRLDWCRDVYFPLAMQHAIMFRVAVLAISALHISTVTGMAMTYEIQYEQSRSLTMLRKHFERSSEEFTDQDIAMCLFSASVDACFEGAGRPIVHMRAAMKFMQSRGGYLALQANTRLMMVLIFFYYRFAHFDIDSLGANDHPSMYGKQPGYSNTDLLFHTLNTHSSTCPNLVTFLHRASALSQIQRKDSYKRIAPLRHNLFQKDKCISHFLQNLNKDVHLFKWPQSDETLHLVLLVQLNMVLLDFRDDHELTSLFLQTFESKLQEMREEGHRSMRAVIWVLIQLNSDQRLSENHWQRLWDVGQILKIIVRLDKDQELWIRKTLLANLTFQDLADNNSLWEGL